MVCGIIFRFLVVQNNALYVLLLCSSEMHPNQNYIGNQYRWNNQEMKVLFYSHSSNIILVNYSLQATV